MVEVLTLFCSKDHYYLDIGSLQIVRSIINYAKSHLKFYILQL